MKVKAGGQRSGVTSSPFPSNNRGPLTSRLVRRNKSFGLSRRRLQGCTCDPPNECFAVKISNVARDPAFPHIPLSFHPNILPSLSIVSSTGNPTVDRLADAINNTRFISTSNLSHPTPLKFPRLKDSHVLGASTDTFYPSRETVL